MSLGPHLLGRREPQDFTHVERHPLRALTPAASVEVVLPDVQLSAYDQGQTPRCVAYSTSRVISRFNRYAFDPDWLYAECKKIDGWPNEDGTSARYACDVLREQGHWRTIRGVPVKAGAKPAHGIESNTWATSVEDIRAVFAQPAPEPVLIGSNWYDAWFAPSEPHPGEYTLPTIARAGAVAGGHEYGLWAASDKRQAFGIRNTWGKLWPPLVWIAYADVEALLADGADACVLHDRATR